MKTFIKPALFALIFTSLFSCSNINTLVDSSELPAKPQFFYQTRPTQFIDITLLPELMTYGDSLLMGNLGEDPFSWMFGYHPGSFNLPSGFYGRHYYSRYAHGYYWGDAPTIQGFDGNFFTKMETPSGLQYTNYFRPDNKPQYDHASYQRFMTQVKPVRSHRGKVKFHMKRSNCYSYSLDQRCKSESGYFIPMFNVPGLPGYGGSNNGGSSAGYYSGGNGSYTQNGSYSNTGNTVKYRQPASGGGGGNTQSGHQAPLPSTPAPAGNL